MTYEIGLVSACLLGVSCRYDGTRASCPEVFDELWHSHFIPVCPEQLGAWAPAPNPCSQPRNKTCKATRRIRAINCLH